MIKSLILISITTACLALAVYLVGLDEIVNTLGIIDSVALMVAGLCIAASHFVAAIRLGAILRTFEQRPDWRQVLFAFSIGQVSNHFLFNILGQSVSRAMALSRAGVPVAVSIMTTYVERLLAACVLFVFAVAGLWFLLQYISFDFTRGGGYLLFLAASAFLVAATVTFSLVGGRVFSVVKASAAWFLRLWPSVALTVVIHGLTLAGYIVLIENVSPGSLTLGVVAALVIVMFTASLPISFSGWGVRELSAASALSLVELPTSTAVAAAVAIGVLSLLVMAAFAFASLLLRRGARSPAPLSSPPSDDDAFRWDTDLAQGCAFFCAMFIFFQLRIPLTAGALTVNVADAGAVTGLGLFIYLVASRRLHYPLPSFVTIALVIISALLGTGMLSALIQDNFGRWALVNRGVGWLVILGYVAAGALAVALLGERLRGLILKAVLISGLSVCVIQLAMMGYEEAAVRIPRDVFPMPLEGFVNNQNAFAFQLTVVAVCLLVGLRAGLFVRPPLFTVGFVLLTLAVYYSKSRVGMIMLLLAAAAMWALSFRAFFERATARRQLRIAGCMVPITIFMAALLPYMIYGLASLLADAPSSMLLRLTAPDSLGIKVTHDLSDSERIEIFTQAWNLWLERPILGSGLGSFVEWRLAHGHEAQVIHSIPLWLMVEMGLAGLVVLLATAVWLFRHAWSKVSTPSGLGFVGILLCMAIGGLLHDFFFQRIFWFLLGVFCAVPAADTAMLSRREMACTRA